MHRTTVQTERAEQRSYPNNAMKAALAFDSFKGCLSSREAALAARSGLMDAGMAGDDILCYTMSDGGEGFCEAVSSYLDGSMVQALVHSPLGDEVTAEYFLTADGTAYIESASACGYTLVPKDRRNPFATSSYGLGELIQDAAAKGASKIVVGLGGTSTCDAGVGMLQALGVKFFVENSDDGILPDGTPALLSEIIGIDARSLCGWSIPMEAWVDTEAGFCGNDGAVRMFGRQKGLSDELIPSADNWMFRMDLMYRKFVRGLFRKRLWNRSGCGAAGGIGGALYAMLKAQIKSGAEEVIAMSGLRDRLLDFADPIDLVLTGEGNFDIQTMSGKLPFIVADAVAEIGSAKLFNRKARTHTRLVCLCGRTEILQAEGFEDIRGITPAGTSEADALDPVQAAARLRKAAAELL